MYDPGLKEKRRTCGGGPDANPGRDQFVGRGCSKATRAADWENELAALGRKTLEAVVTVKFSRPFVLPCDQTAARVIFVVCLSKMEGLPEYSIIVKRVLAI